MTPEALNTILERIAQRQQTEQDMEVLRRSLRFAGDTVQWVSQDGKFNTNVGQITGGAVHIGDRIYQGASAEAIRDIIQSLLQELQATAQPNVTPLKAVDELVQQVRSRLHDDIQRLHGTMPLWGVDHWVPLGDLFVDVNILEELSSSRRSELADLWQDFSQNPSYRSLDRIGLGEERQRVSGLEVLAKHTNLMVVGKPGSGKTTYLQRVVTECNAGNLQVHKIPVLIRLRDFVDDGRDIAYSLEQYLEDCWQLSATETQLVLSQGRSLVLLDGLDEVTGEDGKTIIKQIKRFARANPQVQMIVTCRTQSQESRFERFDSVEVADFNEPQVRAFAEHWFQTVCANQGAGQAKAQVFLEQIFQEGNKPIRELAITPILLSLTCAVFQRTGKFYSKRSKLYEEGLGLLLEQWDKWREIERDEIYRDLSLERKLELLSYLAVKKFEQEQYVLFEQTELEGYIAEFLGIGLRESRTVLRAIEAQHGLLIERSQKIWSFSHLTFQEYCVAQHFAYVLDQGQILHSLTSHFFEASWRQVFLLLMEMDSNTNTLLIAMKGKIDQSEENQSLQIFIRWVYEKSLGIQDTYKPLAVRAFYYNFDKPWFRDQDMKLAKEIDSNLSFGLLDDFLYKQRNYYFPWKDEAEADYAHACAIPLRLDHDLKLAHECAYSFEKVLYDFLELFNEETGKSDLAEIHIDLDNSQLLTEDDFGEEYFDTDQLADLDIFLHKSYKNALHLNEEFANELNHLGLVLWDLKPDGYDSFKEWEIYRDWWKENKYNWIAKLESLAQKHRKLFMTDTFGIEKVKLERHRYAIGLFFDCLDISRIDPQLKYCIEETLLLPITEIEKRNREKSW